MRNNSFTLLWVGETTSTIGSAVTATALPMVAVFDLHAGTFETAALSAATWAPWLAFGLPAGAIVDRHRRRPVMLFCDLASLLLLASVPLAYWTGALSIVQLFVVAAGAGVTAVFFSTAYLAYLPHILGPTDRDVGNAKVFGSASAASLIGPGLAGLIARASGAATALLADAVSFAVSAACLLAIRTDEQPPARRTSSMRRDIGDGMRLAVHDPYLRTLTVWGGLANLSLTMSQSVMVLFLLRTLGVNAAIAGLVLAAGSLGGIVGAFSAASVGRRLGTARGLLVCELGTAPFGMLIPITHHGPALIFVVVGTVVPAAGIAAGNVIQLGFTQSYCPPWTRGRLSATQNVVNYGTKPIGALLAGGLGAVIDVRATLWISTVALVATGIVLLRSPIRSRRSLPVEQSVTDDRVH